MELSFAENHLKKLAGLLGVVQGLGYGIMALICVVMYNRRPTPFDVHSYMDTVNYYMYVTFFNKNISIFSDQTLRPINFTIFVWIYLISSVIWLGISADVWFKKGVTLPKHLKAWSYITLLISLADFIFVVILASDYHKCLQWATWDSRNINDIIGHESICTNGILPVLVIAARGFVLWIINVTLAYILRKISLNLKKGATAQVQQTQILQHSVQNPPRPIGYPIQQPMPQQDVYLDQTTPYPQYAGPASNYNNQYEYQIPMPMPQPEYYNQQPLPGMRKNF